MTPRHRQGARDDAPLVLAGHGSSDPRYAEVMAGLATRLATLRPRLEVRIGYLDHGPPVLADVCAADCVVVPVLLTNGYHAHIDIPTQAHGALVAAPVGPDPRLARVMADRLRAAGWGGAQPVVLAAAGSVDPRALDDARTAAGHLARELGVSVDVAFVGSGEPRLPDVPAAAVASYLIGPGRFADAVSARPAPVVAAPLGAHPLIADVILDRYDLARSSVPAHPARHARPADPSDRRAALHRAGR